MARKYLLIAFRNLYAHKGYSPISIGGLVISMSVCLLIITFVKQEWSHDTFHPDADRIYHLYSDFKAGINPTSDLYGTDLPPSMCPHPELGCGF
jgi:putative ABC transport system permease protein